jgi:hypothetical protein
LWYGTCADAAIKNRVARGGERRQLAVERQAVLADWRHVRTPLRPDSGEDHGVDLDGVRGAEQFVAEVRSRPVVLDPPFRAPNRDGAVDAVVVVEDRRGDAVESRLEVPIRDAEARLADGLEFSGPRALGPPEFRDDVEGLRHPREPSRVPPRRPGGDCRRNAGSVSGDPDRFRLERAVASSKPEGNAPI